MADGASGILRQQIVLLHGATASARVWDEVVPRLIVSHDVWIPTLAGHLGGPPLSVAPVDLVESIVDDVSQRLDEADIGSAHLVGNSLGGWVALELARRGRASSVLAFAPAGAWNSAADLSRMERIFRVGAVLSRSKNIRRLMASGTVRRLLLRGMAERADRLTPAQAISALDDMAGCSVSADFVAGVRKSGPIASFDRLPCPVRFAWGHCDRTLPFMRYGASMLAAAPGSELTVLPSVGHVPMVDDPALVARVILDYVGTAAAGQSAG